MTRKHFAAIAYALKVEKANKDICEAVASQVSQFNGKFNRERFLTACGQ